MAEQPRPTPLIGLAELIVAVRDELEKADAARLDRADDATLELREVELELQFEVRRSRPGRGGLDLLVLSAEDGTDGTDAGATATPTRQTQKLRVLYGPAFKLVEIDEGVGTTVPDWLHAPPRSGPAARSEAPVRLALDELAEIEELGDLGDLGEVGKVGEVGEPPGPEIDTSEV